MILDRRGEEGCSEQKVTCHPGIQSAPDFLVNAIFIRNHIYYIFMQLQLLYCVLVVYVCNS
jgi:hypothetical protein